MSMRKPFENYEIDTKIGNFWAEWAVLIPFISVATTPEEAMPRPTSP